jgi:hypothetical protein
MATRISAALGVKHDALESQGALDAFVDLDSQFHIHPALLGSATTPELRDSEKRVEGHFGKIIRLLDLAQADGDPLYKTAEGMMIFPEIPLAGLGYSRENTQGRAIGTKLARQITQTGYQIVKAGIKDPIIFELVGLFEEGVASDLLSDMVLALILPDILKFNDRVATKLGLPTEMAQIGGEVRALPYSQSYQKPILLIPKEILSPLPVATCWDDIDTVCNYNDAVRDTINKKVGKTWGDARSRLHKSQLKALLLRNPELLKDLIEQYKRKAPQKYDYTHDSEGELIWYEQTLSYAKSYPLTLPGFNPADHQSVVRTVLAVCKKFKQLVENNGLFKLFYNQDRSLKPERAAQLLFFGIADAYCEANNLDLSREPDAGRGPVDFKVSKGYRSRLNVEIKFTSNKKLISGYESQLATYDEAEKTFHSIYLVIDTVFAARKMARLKAVRAQRMAEGKRSPDIIEIDGTYRDSASKLT